jgi:hypothetical protein
MLLLQARAIFSAARDRPITAAGQHRYQLQSCATAQALVASV